MSIDFPLPWNGGSQTVVHTSVTWKTHYKPVLLGLTHRVSDSVGLWWTSRCAFLASFCELLMLLAWDHTWRMIPLDESPSAAMHESSWSTVPAERWAEAALGASLPELLEVVMVWIMAQARFQEGSFGRTQDSSSCVWQNSRVCILGKLYQVIIRQVVKALTIHSGIFKAEFQDLLGLWVPIRRQI